MAQVAQVKRVFAGSNTGVGFHSFFHHIAGPEIEHVHVIKGGPGTGKSTLMSYMAEKSISRGFSVELHHCSSDIKSLDGLVIPALKVAFIDGTKPHMYDPRLPGALDEIVNLGEYWDAAGIQRHKQEIMAANIEGNRLFNSAYRYLGAARKIHENWADKVSMMQDWGWVNQRSKELCKSIMGQRPVASQPGRERHLFASAFTPEGPKSYVETVAALATIVIIIKGQPGTGKSTLLSKVAGVAKEEGYLAEIYHSPIDPMKLQHVLLPELGVFVGTSTELFPFTPARDWETVNLDYGLNPERTNYHRSELETDRQTFLQLLNTGIGLIKKARETHMAVEGFYVANMNFTALDGLKEKLEQEVFAKL